MPHRQTQTTHFDIPERLTREMVAAERDAVATQPLVALMLDGFPEPAMLVNRYRQVVVANDKAAALLGCTRDALVGQRIGEAFSCEHAFEQPAGCGTTEACVMCGAARALYRTVRDRVPVRNECRISRVTPEGPDALDLRVWTTPLDVGGVPYTIVAVRDTTDEQRRKVLERLFFHDVLNAAGSLQGLMEIWTDLGPEEAAEMSARAAQIAGQVVEEIQAQRDLTAAERGELAPRREPVRTAALATSIVDAYTHHPVARDRSILLRPCATHHEVTTDPVLFRRVLGDLLKNGLEASSPGERVTIWCDHGERLRIHVHNPAVMPDMVRLQVFQRSFSTKPGRGRGVGTYSARLLVEKYLCGTLTFVSAPETGTIFTIDLPDDPPAILQG